MARIGGGDLPTIAVDPKNENVVYSCSTVFWRTEDGGITWSAVRGAPGGDDYQKTWINPINPDIILAGLRSGRRGLRQSRQVVEQLVHAAHRGDVSRHARTMRSPTWCAAASRTPDRRASTAARMDGEITFHDWHPVNIQEYGVAAPDPKDPDLVYAQPARPTSRSTIARPDRRRRSGPTRACGRPRIGRNVRTMPIDVVAGRPDVLFYASNAVFKTINGRHTAGRGSAPRPDAPDVGRAGERRQVCRRRDAGAAGRDHRAVAVAARASRSSGRAPTTATSR